MGVSKGLVALVAVAIGLSWPATADAVTYSQDYDALAGGVGVTTGPGGLTMPLVTQTFNAAGKTWSDPNAIRRPGDCPNSGADCTTGNHRIIFQFDSAHRARSVSLRAGTVVPNSCFELDCPTMQLVGYDGANNIVASTPVTTVTNPEITKRFAIDAFAYTIKKAIFVVSGDPLSGNRRPGDGYQYTAQIDNLTYDVDEGDPPPPPPPSPPSVAITDPGDGETFASTDVPVSGTVNAPAGAANFCVTANTPSFPADCNRTGQIRPDGSFDLLRIPGMRPGANTITAWVRDGLGRTAGDSVDVSVAAGDVDFITESIEVTQAVQTERLPQPTGEIRLPGLGSVPGEAYDGVPLAREKPTIARVYGAARGADSPVRGVTAQLRGYRRIAGNYVELPGSPLRPHGSPPSLQADPSLPALRAAADGSFNFILPREWTDSGRELHLAATVAPTPSGAVGDCCPANNSFALAGIPFTQTRSLTMYPVPANWTKPDGTAMTAPDPITPLFDGMETVFPGPFRVIPLPAIEVSDVVNPELAKADPSGFAIDDGVIAQLEEMYGDSTAFNGKILGMIPGIGPGKGPGKIGATGSIGAALDFVAHEGGHQWGLAHAHRDDGCTDADKDGSFDGPVSKRGPLLGVGLDPRFWSGGSIGRFKPIAPEKAGVFDATPNAPANVYDYMSYCSNEGAGKTWVSAPYWATEVRELAPGGAVDTGFSGGCCFLGAAGDPTVLSRRASAAAVEGPIMHVSASLRYKGPPHRLLRVEQGTGEVDLGPSSGGPPVHVIVRRADNSVISDSEVIAEIASARSTTDDDLYAAVNVSVPSAPDAARVEIRASNILLLARNASANPPTVKLLKPKPGTKIKRKGRFTVKLRRADVDGDPVLSRIEFSTNRGRSWRPLAARLTGSRTRIPGRLLPHTRKGIIRVVTRDGFAAASDQHGKIKAQGSRPTAVISSPQGRRLKVLSDTELSLSGYGYDDAGKPLKAKKLKWVSRGKRIGGGESVDVPVRKLGRTVKLIAKDGRRRGTDKLKLKIKKTAPVFTTLETGKLKRKARKLKLRAASSLPGRLKVSGKGVKPLKKRISTKTKRFKVKLKGKRKRYRIKLLLSASGKKSATTVTVKRG